MRRSPGGLSDPNERPPLIVPRDPVELTAEPLDGAFDGLVLVVECGQCFVKCHRAELAGRVDELAQGEVLWREAVGGALRYTLDLEPSPGPSFGDDSDHLLGTDPGHLVKALLKADGLSNALVIRRVLPDLT